MTRAEAEALVIEEWNSRPWTLRGGKPPPLTQELLDDATCTLITEPEVDEPTITEARQ